MLHHVFIISWNPMIIGNKTEPYPVLYIDHDTDFIPYIGQSFYVFIKHTNSPYDGVALAKLEHVDNIGTPRPNFERTTGFLCLVLDVAWNGYPPENGDVMFELNKNDIIHEDKGFFGKVLDFFRR